MPTMALLSYSADFAKLSETIADIKSWPPDEAMNTQMPTSTDNKPRTGSNQAPVHLILVYASTTLVLSFINPDSQANFSPIILMIIKDTAMSFRVLTVSPKKKTPTNKVPTAPMPVQTA